jgi:O-antigen ligase
MKQLFLINDSLANKISYYHFMLFLASLPFDGFYSHVLLMSLGVHTIIQYKKEYARPVFTLRNLALISVFLVTAASTIYTINQPEAFTEWGRRSTILIMPLFFCFTGLDLKKYRNNLLLAFALLCTATVFYLFVYAMYTIRYYHLPVSWLFTQHFTNQNFSEPIQMHATFFSMQLAIAFLTLLAVLVKETRIKYKVFYLCCIGMLAAGLFQLGAKSVMACVFILVLVAVPHYLLPKASRLKFRLAIAALALLPVLIVLWSDSLRERYVTALRGDLSHIQNNEGAEPRLVRWEAATALMAKKPVIGYGAGSEIGLLQDVFYNKKIYYAYLNKLNIHSEYLSFVIKSGVIGLLVYLLTLGFGFKQGIKNKDLLMLTFMAIIACVSLSENLLDVDKGIIFYAFFFSFFLFSADENKSVKKDDLLTFVATNDRFESSLVYKSLSPENYRETVY